MKKTIFAISAVLILTSCAMTVPFKATNNEVGTKIGRSTTFCLMGGASSSYHGIMFNKNFGIVEAAKKGGIEQIGLVDFKVTNYWIVTKKEFIVSGE